MAIAPRWTDHALRNLIDREIDPAEADRALAAPDLVVAGHAARTIFLRRYRDAVLGKEMVLCLVVEQEQQGRVVVTVYKTSKIEKYFRRGEP